jgi:hypothetical protein
MTPDKLRFVIGVFLVVVAAVALIFVMVAAIFNGAVIHVDQLAVML